MSKALPADRSWPSLPDLDLIASQTRLIIRNSRKFTAAGFLQSLLSSVATGLASLNQIAGDLKDRDHPGMARQSLHQHFDIRSTAFLMTVLGDLMQQRYSTAATAIGTSGIQRILIENASSQVMPKSNADEFPAHGNHYGKTAGVKIDLAYDLLTGSIVSHGLHAATEQDKTIGKKCRLVAVRADPKVSAARRDLPRPLGGGNSIPRMEAGAQPRQSPQSQEQRTSSTSPSAGRDDRPPARNEDSTADRKHSWAGKTEL
jgi:hypothetical protein